MSDAREAIAEIRRLAGGERVRVLNVCGGHERTIAHSGLRSVLADCVELIPGPGCPVCVCPEEDIYLAIQIAMKTGAILCAFGDMLRVPANVPKGEPRSLEEARAAGAGVVAVASPQAVWKLATENPERDVVFFAAGFETTMAPVAARIAEGVPKNLSVLLSGRRTWPAVAALLESPEIGFDALIAPGHVSTIMGANEWRFVAEESGIPTAIAGFTTDDLISATRAAVAQWRAGRATLENCYPRAVQPEGNPTARRILEEVFVVDDANWRGIGVLPASGYAFSERYAHLDARARHVELADKTRSRLGEMPPGCSCADVVLGKLRPTGCPLYGFSCTPRTPVGPCMVSDEGSCRIWWASGIRERERDQARGDALR